VVGDGDMNKRNDNNAWEAAIRALEPQNGGDVRPLAEILRSGRPVPKFWAFTIGDLLDPSTFDERGYGFVIKRIGKPPGRPRKQASLNRVELYFQMKSERDAGNKIDVVILKFEERTSMSRSTLYKIWQLGQMFEDPRDASWMKVEKDPQLWEELMQMTDGPEKARKSNK
jgi:hypothetical protein